MKRLLFMNKLLVAGFIFGAFSCKQLPEQTINEDMIVSDPHSYAKPAEAIMTHLDWKATVNFDQKIIHGEAAVTFSKSADAEELILDSKGLQINQVYWDNGDPAKYKIGSTDEILGQPIHIQLREGEDRVIIEYSTSPEAEALQWLDPQQTAGKELPFLFTQSQAILARSWIPLQDSPGIRFSYDAEVQVPEGLLALMSAKNPQTVNKSGLYFFTMKQPVPAYLMALAVGDLKFASLGLRSGVYAEPPMLERSAYEFAELERMISDAEELYGPYQWERYDLIVLPPSFPFGGMENPRLTFVTPTILAGDRSLTSLVAHELAHSWSGNLVTNATWNDFWLNEGFTVYFEQRIMESMYGRDYSEMLAKLSYDGLQDEIAEMVERGKGEDTSLKLSLDGRDPDEGMTSIAYDKGYLFLRSIEEEVGRDKFDNFLKEYFNKNAFKVMTTEAFLEYLQKHLYEAEGLEYQEQRINQWVYSAGLPKDAPTPESDKFAKVEKQLQEWLQGKAAADLTTEAWSSHEWMHFIRSLPDDLSNEKVKELDNTFKLTASGNSEVLTSWLIKAIRYQYEESYKKLEDFLVNTGRRKFLMPLYKELIKTNEGEILARRIYGKARPNYHYVSTSSIDELLK